FLGLNYYTTTEVSAGFEETDAPLRPPGPDQPDDTTEMGWLIDPDGLRDYLMYLTERYEPASIMITENGASYSTGPGPSGEVDDVKRIGYLDSHIGAVLEAIDRGAPVDGYFVWSLLDNLEWVAGFSQRFGLVWVDFDTMERIPKRSFYWYRDRITGI
ncbi:MAG: family 1 glycosylhydrolase, partial [Acidimicrobiia bacterium]|nr:family 1 glycosylhydrolase [Acidimicrobiia bacterium]